MVPCLEDEGCDLLVNKSGWTCTQPGGRVKTTTVSSGSQFPPQGYTNKWVFAKRVDLLPQWRREQQESCRLKFLQRKSIMLEIQFEKLRDALMIEHAVQPSWPLVAPHTYNNNDYVAPLLQYYLCAIYALYTTLNSCTIYTSTFN